MKTILTPVDFSPATDAVVAEAAALARAVEGRVVLLTVVEPPVMRPEYAPLMRDVAEITAADQQAAEKNLAKLKDDLERDQVPAETLHVVGSSIAHITSEAAKLKADYIVMGSHGHAALYDLVVGSTTHGVLMRATCPVVVIPPAKAHTTSKASS